MKKGFLHIVEIIIVSLLMFLVISQFTYIPRLESDWSGTKLYLQGNDLISVMDKDGTDWIDILEVTSKIESILPENVEYDLKLKNVIKPRILVGCICNPSEYNDVSRALTSPPTMTINRHTIQIIPEQIPTGTISFDLKYDVIIIGASVYDTIDGNDNMKSELERFLSYDKGVIEMVDLDITKSGGITLGEFQENVFNVLWDNDLPVPSTDDIEFSTTFSEYVLKPPIEKYFYHFENSSGDIYREEKPYYFNNFLSNNVNNPEKVNVFDGMDEKIILKQIGTEIPACIINYNINYGIIESVGRTAWLSDNIMTDDLSVLVKAITAWAGGDIYDIATGYFQEGRSISFSFFKLLNEDMYQPIEILLTLGYFYTYEA